MSDMVPMQQEVTNLEIPDVHRAVLLPDENGNGRTSAAASHTPDHPKHQGTSDASEREFTFPTLERLTPDLSAAERLAVFIGLPVDLRHEAWRELGQRIESQSRAQFAEERLGGVCTSDELAAEIAALWPECRTVPLGRVGERPPRARAAKGRRSQHADRVDSDLELLRSIPSAEYVALLTGRDANRAGYVRCALHDDRTPSLHVSADDGRWYCFGCAQGGALFEFYAALHGRQVPRAGVEFVEFVREVAGAVIGGAGGKC